MSVKILLWKFIDSREFEIDKQSAFPSSSGIFEMDLARVLDSIRRSGLGHPRVLSVDGRIGLSGTAAQMGGRP